MQPKKKKNHDSWASTVQTTEHNPHLKSDYSDTRFSAEAPITSPTWNLLQVSCLFKPSPRSQGHSVAFPAGSTPPAMWSFPSSSAFALKAHVCHLPPPHTHTHIHPRCATGVPSSHGLVGSQRSHLPLGRPMAASLTPLVKVTQSCPTLCDPMDYIVQGILQARILEWVDFPFSRGSSQPKDWTQVSHTAGGFFTSRATREAQHL